MVKIESVDVSYDGQEGLQELIQCLVRILENYPDAKLFNEGYITLDLGELYGNIQKH